MDMLAPHAACLTADEAAALREALDALLDFTGATAGWIGLVRPDGRLHFPARAGIFSEAWLTLQQGQNSIWGFAVRAGPIVLNHPLPLPLLGDPPLRNLLSCLLRRATKPLGQLVLANKSQRFTSRDVTAAQTMAFFLSRRLVPEAESARPAWSAALPYRVLDQLQEGILIVDHTGSLVFANATWAEWTGYSREELCNRPAPFPFWVSHTELAKLGESRQTLADTPLSGQGSATRSTPATAAPEELFPFRHRNHSLFWCRMETTTAEIAGQHLTIALLRRVPTAPGAARSPRRGTPGQTAAPAAPAPASQASSSQRPLKNVLTLLSGPVAFRETEKLALLVRPGGLIDLWDERWEELTGLPRAEVASIGSELFLDWLFPRQHERSFVADLFHQPERRGAQALLEVAGRSGNRRLLFTFLPVQTSDVRWERMAMGEEGQGSLPGLHAPLTDAWLILACPRETGTAAARPRHAFSHAACGASASPFMAESPCAKQLQVEGKAR